MDGTHLTKVMVNLTHSLMTAHNGQILTVMGLETILFQPPKETIARLHLGLVHRTGLAV